MDTTEFLLLLLLFFVSCRFLLHHLGNGEDAAEETIVQAVQTTLVGNTYVFCLKTNTPLRRVTTDSGTQQTHPGPPSPLRLVDLLNAHPPPQRHGGKLSDFIAVQMVRTGRQGASGHPTVMEVLKSRVAGSASGSQPTPDKDSSAPNTLKPAASRGRKTPVRNCRLKRRRSLRGAGSGTPGSQAGRPRPLRSDTGDTGCAGADCAAVSSPRRCSPSSSSPSSSSSSSSSSPSCSPAEDFLSQNCSAGPSSAMFSCQSSMEREFPSGLSLTCSVRSWGGNSQACPEGGEEDSQRGTQQRNGPSASVAPDDSSALAFRHFLSGSDAPVAAKNSCGSSNSETCSEPRLGATKRERPSPFSRNPASTDETLPNMTVIGENGTDMTVSGENGTDMTVSGENGTDMTVIGENSTGSGLTVMADFESPMLGISLLSFRSTARREEFLPEVPESPHCGACLNLNLSCRKDAGSSFSTSLNDSFNLSCRKDAGSSFSTSLNDSFNLSCRKDAGASFSTSLNDSSLLLAACEANENPLRPGGCGAVLGQVGPELLGNGAQARLAKLPEQNLSVSACEGATGCHNTVHHDTESRNTGCQNTGCHNTVRHNTGCQNTVRHNTGCHNTGCRNTSCHGVNQTELRQGVINACAAAQNPVKVSFDADMLMPDSEDLSLFLDVMAGETAEKIPENPKPKETSQQPKQVAALRSLARRRSGSDRQPKASCLDRRRRSRRRRSRLSRNMSATSATRCGSCSVAETSTVTPTTPAGESGENTKAASGGLIPEEGCSAGCIADAELDRGRGSSESEMPGGDPFGDSTLSASGLAQAFSFENVPACVSPDGPSSGLSPVSHSYVRVSDKQLSTHVSDRCSRTRVSDKQLSTHASDQPSPTCMSDEQLSDRHSPTCVSDKQLSTHVSDQSSPTCMSDKQLSDRYSPTCVSDKQLSTHVSDQSSPACMSDKQLSDRHSPTCMSDKQLSTHVSDQSSPTCMSDKQLSDRHSPTCMSDKQLSTHVSNRHSPTCMSDKRSYSGKPDNARVSDKESDSPGVDRQSPTHQAIAPGLLDMPDSEDLSVFLNRLLDAEKDATGGRQDSKLTRSPAVECRQLATGEPHNRHSDLKSSSGDSAPAPCLSESCRTLRAGRERCFAYEPPDVCPVSAQRTEATDVVKQRDTATDSETQEGSRSVTSGLGHSETELCGRRACFSRSEPSETPRDEVPHCADVNRQRPARLKSPRRADGVLLPSEDRSERAESFLDGSAELFSSPSTDEDLSDVEACGGIDWGDSHLAVRPARKPPSAHKARTVTVKNDNGAERFGSSLPSDWAHRTAASSADERLDAAVASVQRHHNPDVNPVVFHGPVDAVSVLGKDACLVSPSPKAACHRQGTPTARQRRKVRFSRRGRVSSVSAIDSRLQRYGSPQPESQSPLLIETPVLRPGRSCLRQPLSPLVTVTNARVGSARAQQCLVRSAAGKRLAPSRSRGSLRTVATGYLTIRHSTPQESALKASASKHGTAIHTTPKSRALKDRDVTPKRTTRRATPKHTTPKSTAPKHTPKYTSVKDTTPKHTPKYITVKDTTPKHTPKYTSVKDTTRKHTPKYTTVKDTTPKHTAMPTSAKQPEQASNSPENSGSQDLFSPCLAPHRAEGVDQDPQAPASASVEEMRTPQGRTWGGALSDRGPAWSVDSASRGCQSLCLFDESAVLFDDVENIPETLPRSVERLEVKPTPGRCTRLAAASNVLFDDVENVPENLPRSVEHLDVKPTPGRCTRLTAASAIEDKVTRVPRQRALSELHNFSLASLASPDLFSP